MDAVNHALHWLNASYILNGYFILGRTPILNGSFCILAYTYQWGFTSGNRCSKQNFISTAVKHSSNYRVKWHCVNFLFFKKWPTIFRWSQAIFYLGFQSLYLIFFLQQRWLQSVFMFLKGPRLCQNFLFTLNTFFYVFLKRFYIWLKSRYLFGEENKRKREHFKVAFLLLLPITLSVKSSSRL